MVPSGGIELLPIDSLWTGSIKSVWDITPGMVGGEFPIWAIICTAFAVILIFSKKIFPFLSGINPLAAYPLSQAKQQTTLISTIIYLAIIFLSSGIASGALLFLNHSFPLSFSFLLLIIATITLLKVIILYIIGTVTETPCIKSLATIFCLCLATVSFLLMLYASALYVFPGINGNTYCAYFLILSIAAVLLIYLHKLCITLFSAGVSLFYSFLYLCTVEILPIVIIAVMFIRL